MRAAVVVLVGLVVACSPPGSAPAIDKLRPPWAPLSGGTTIDITGAFDPYVNRVFVAGREAPIVRTLDAEHLEVVVPPGDAPGDADLVVIANDENVTATGLFHYSAPPAIASVTPAKVLVSDLPTTVVVHGSGFVDEEAGVPVVVVGGQVIEDVHIRDDATLSFKAPTGIAFTRPEIEVMNQRGRASARGFRYAVSDAPGVLIYATSGEGAFGWFYAPATQELTTIPRTGGAQPCIYAAMTGAGGDHMASAYCLPSYSYARVDFEAQSLVDIVPTTLYYAMTRHEGVNYGIDLNARRFGSFADDGTGFTAISPTLTGFQFGLASTAGTLYVAMRDAASVPSISTIDPATGERGPTMPLAQPVDVYDMVALDGALYAVTSDARLVTIDPATGAVMTLATFGVSYALDVIE